MNYFKYSLLALMTFSLCLSKGLDPGIFYKNRQQKIKEYQAEEEEGRRSNIFHTLNSLGESYMDLVQFVSDNIITKIQNSLSLEYYLTKKQDEIQFQNSGYNQQLYKNDMEDEEEWKKEHKSRPEHKSAKFRVLTDQYLEQERQKNKSNVREFDSFDRLVKNPTVLTIAEENNDSKAEGLKHEQRLLQNDSIPKDGEIIRFGLKDTCQNSSYMVLVQQTTYFCNGVMISEHDYKLFTPDQITKNNCTTRSLKFESCLCPVDFTGRRCEYETRVYCNMTILNKKQCEEMNEFAYVSQYSGLPPCAYVSNQIFINYIVKAECQNMLPPPKQPQVYGANSDHKILFNEKPPSAPSNWTPFSSFTYFFQQGNLMISRPRNITPQVQYINWNVLGNSVKDSYQQKFTLTGEQLTGQKTFNLALNFRNLSPDIITSGRYTVEFNLFEQFNYSNKDPFVLVASGIQFLVFEEEGYVEPTSHKVNKKLIIAIVILIIVAVILIAYSIFYYFRQRNIQRNKRKVTSALDDNSLHQNFADQSPNRVPMLAQENDGLQEAQQQEQEYQQ